MISLCDFRRDYPIYGALKPARYLYRWLVDSGHENTSVVAGGDERSETYQHACVGGKQRFDQPKVEGLA
ncbi:hypothetical protein O9992_08580 [Vibrio lentus]|nr:hypothetical protein [Vibrio lentus]